MIFAKRIQKTIGKVILKRSHRRTIRKRLTHNLSTAEKIGVVFAPSNSEDLKVVKKFLAFLKQLEIKVFPLAFIDPKKTNINVVMEQQINFIDRKDFNWYHKPLTPELKKFINEDFDILINLCIESSLSMNFVVSQSKAKLKAGKYFENGDNFCDLLIDIKDSNNISYLIEQISHYLSVINNTK